MSSMNILGTYSGITMDTIDQLIAAEKSKGVKFTNQKTKIETEQNAWKDVNTRLDNLFKKLETLTKEETFQSRTVKSNVSGSGIISVSASKEAAEGQYNIQVKQLAESARLTGAQVSIENVESIHDELNLEGAFTFTVDGSKTYEIEITNEDSLKDIIDKINVKTNDSGIQASIVDTRLVLTNTNLGESTISVSSKVENADGELVDNISLASQLGFEDGKTAFSEGQSAIFTINDIQVERNTNSINDVVEGMTFNLTSSHKDGESEVITVAADTKKTEAAVKDFVDQYNSVMSFIDTQLDVGDPSADNNKVGALTGDGAVMRLQSTLRSLMTRNLEGNYSGDFKNIEDLGVTLDRDGRATLDSAKFQEALQEDPANVARFFYNERTVTTSVVNDDGETVSKSHKEKEGMSELLRNFIDTYISTSTTAPGIISNKNTTFDRMLKDITEQIDVFNERVDRKRDRYIQQFTALDIAMMEAQSQMDYLYSQIGLGQD